MTNQERVLVAMSGGVDSSVAAHLLLQAGYDCAGATMQMFSPEEIGTPPDLAGVTNEWADAAMIAEKLSIDFEVIASNADFRRHVIDYFIQTYENGGTPNPCVECNRYLKFGKFLDHAKQKGFDKIATGHYARIQKNAGGRFYVSSAADASKDQTYVLWQLSQDQLAHTLMPLGEYKKEDIREIAEKNGFCNARRRDSQDVCFIPDGDYVSFIQRMTGANFPTGDFVDLQGNRIGSHQGAIRYTIGQRKGLGIAFGKPTYVCRKCMRDNTVTLGDNADLFSRELTAHGINLMAVDRLDAPVRLLAKIRYNAKAAVATVEQTDEDTIRVLFDEPQRAICQGQSVVLYDGNDLIGGGIID